MKRRSKRMTRKRKVRQYPSLLTCQSSPFLLLLPHLRTRLLSCPFSRPNLTATHPITLSLYQPRPTTPISTPRMTQPLKEESLFLLPRWKNSKSSRFTWRRSRLGVIEVGSSKSFLLQSGPPLFPLYRPKHSPLSGSRIPSNRICWVDRACLGKARSRRRNRSA